MRLASRIFSRSRRSSVGDFFQGGDLEGAFNGGELARGSTGGDADLFDLGLPIVHGGIVAEKVILRGDPFGMLRAGRYAVLAAAGRRAGGEGDLYRGGLVGVDVNTVGWLKFHLYRGCAGNQIVGQL